MTERQKKMIEGYLPHPRDPELLIGAKKGAERDA